jgi:hypothetical protein
MSLRAGLAASLLLGACGTAYRPKPTPRLTLIVEHGGVAFLKNGHASPVSPLGGDLPELVAADADAVRAARRARHQLAFGVPAYVLGFAGVLVGLSLGKPAKWPVVAGGAVLGVSGLASMGAGATNAIDAVNRYNDAVLDDDR